MRTTNAVSVITEPIIEAPMPAAGAGDDRLVPEFVGASGDDLLHAAVVIAAAAHIVAVHCLVEHFIGYCPPVVLSSNGCADVRGMV